MWWERALMPLSYFLWGGDAELERHTWAVGHGRIHLWSVPVGSLLSVTLGSAGWGALPAFPWENNVRAELKGEVLLH